MELKSGIIRNSALIWTLIIMGQAKEQDPIDRHVTILVYAEGMGQWVLESPHFRDVLYGIRMLSKNGVQADYLLPEFPTVTPTNYFSIFTGLPPSKHKIYGDKLFNPKSGKTIRLDQTNQFNTRPEWLEMPFIWKTAVEQNVSTSLKFWRSCPTSPSSHLYKCSPHKSIRKSEMDQFVSDVVHEILNVGVKLVMIDIDNVSKWSKRFGPTSPSTVNAVQDISKMLYELQNTLASFDLIDRTNVLLVSDHGLVPTSHERYAFVDDFVEVELVRKIVFSGAFAWIYPRENKTYQVHQKLSGNLPHCKLHWTNDVPQRWNLMQGNDAAPLLLLCEPGYGVSCRMPCNEYPKLPVQITTEHFPNALSGYDNASPKMKGIFVARGPDILQPSSETQDNFWLRATDVHELLCRLLKLKCDYEHNSNPNSRDITQLDQISASNTHNVSNILILIISSFICLNLVASNCQNVLHLLF